MGSLPGPLLCLRDQWLLTVWVVGSIIFFRDVSDIAPVNNSYAKTRKNFLLKDSGLLPKGRYKTRWSTCWRSGLQPEMECGLGTLNSQSSSESSNGLLPTIGFNFRTQSLQENCNIGRCYLLQLGAFWGFLFSIAAKCLNEKSFLSPHNSELDRKKKKKDTPVI